MHSTSNILRITVQRMMCLKGHEARMGKRQMDTKF